MRLRQPKRPPKAPFSRDDLQRIASACNRFEERVLVYVLIDTGIRLSELVAIRKRDIDWERGTLRIRHGKGGGQRTVVLSDRTLEGLRLIMADRDYPWYSQRTHGPMQPDGVQRLMRRLSARTGLRVNCHRFRTTWACRFLDETDGNVEAAQILMGHRKLETTLGYAQWGREKRALEAGRRFANRLAG